MKYQNDGFRLIGDVLPSWCVMPSSTPRRSRMAAQVIIYIISIHGQLTKIA